MSENRLEPQMPYAKPELRASEDQDSQVGENKDPRAPKDSAANSDQPIANNGDNEVRSSANLDSDAPLSAVKDFLAGRPADSAILDLRHDAVRQAVAAHLLLVMSGSNSEETAGSDPRELPLPEVPIRNFEEQDEGQLENFATKREPPALVSPSQQDEQQAEQQRARQLFIEQGYLDEAINSLCAADSAEARATAARTLG
ncbi:MAG: hypothetical protein ACRD2L_11965, partial [Terriglobia bacterium]